MRVLIRTTAAALAAVAAGPLQAQQQMLEVRPIGAVAATSTDSISILGGVRHLSNGRLLVNDIMRRQVLLLDESLKLVKVVADSMPGSVNPYGPRPGALVPFRGDSTLFIDASSLSMLVIDDKGDVARVMSVPRSSDAGMMATSALGGMGFDGERMVYRGFGGFRMQMGGARNPGAASTGFSGAPTMPDTMPIVRVNLATRAVDTAAYIKVSTPKSNISQTDDGQFSIAVEINPLPVVDEFAVLSDGRVAVVRGRDYHVEFIDGDGKVTVAPKIPFEWKRLSDEDKVAFIDSVKAQTERAAAAGGNTAAARVGATIGAAMGGAAPPVVMTQMRVSGAAGSAASGQPMPRGATTIRAAAPQVSYINPSELPDYQPAFFGNQARGDMDGNLWVRIIPPKPVAGGAVYDVIDGQGALVDRVQIPADRTIVGFGHGGVVYLTYRDGDNTKLERATFK